MYLIPPEPGYQAIARFEQAKMRKCIAHRAGYSVSAARNDITPSYEQDKSSYLDVCRK